MLCIMMHVLLFFLSSPSAESVCSADAQFLACSCLKKDCLEQIELIVDTESSTCALFLQLAID